MAVESSVPLVGVTLLGLATAVAPCPLATNIAAVTYIARKLTDRRWVVTSGILYTLGRSVTYAVLAGILSAGLTSLPGLSTSLQKYGHLFLGPLLIVFGMLLLSLISIPLPQAQAGHAQKIADRFGVLGAFLLGVLFALAFCPTSAAYFGTVVTLLATRSVGSLGLAFLYGVATGVPVLVFALLVVFAASWVGRAFAAVTVIDRVVRTVTGIVFLLIGIYFVLLYNFDLPVNIFDILS
ncbi:MAG: sulfite exporter TauE/SafE family protein [Thermogutta sp.]|uniref:aromatic aminobenezylarsenical efflux permease ArsG family transporter n=1 Tax=Thermogutta sp. TaxID=1962930 RepID=UPI0019A358E6|nr:aromatic aminobenezylarsenical efflux permease ArsG family transporter [Thermogutta sp.]MBC7351911.1 sulfite exporter TauE/SafE family protein [Thermogutta sp.]